MKSIFDVINPVPYIKLPPATNYNYWDIPYIKENLKNTKVLVEIGVLLGEFSCNIGSLLPDDAIIACVDPWFKDAIYSDWLKTVTNYDPYIQFLSNCIHKGVSEKIVPMKMLSSEAALIFNQNFDLLFVDGDHSEKAVYEDLILWHNKKRNKKSIIAGDDWTLARNGHNDEFQNPVIKRHDVEITQDDTNYEVRLAVKKFAREQGYTINSFGRFWWFE